MARRLAAIVFVLTVFTAIPRAQAQFAWFHSFKDSVVTDFKRNNCWPDPFVCPDRVTVRTPLNVMVRNGWQLQNTISDYHFDETTGQLTEAGKNKIHWILTQAPKQHRIVYVQQTKEPEVTAARLQEVHSLANAYASPDTIARVEITTREVHGWTAERVGFVSQAFEASAPEPRLPAASNSSSTSSK